MRRLAGAHALGTGFAQHPHMPAADRLQSWEEFDA
jgi:hypothetical protein